MNRHQNARTAYEIVRPSRRMTGHRRDRVEGAGWEFAHVAIDDHSRAGFVRMYADERRTPRWYSLRRPWPMTPR